MRTPCNGNDTRTHWTLLGGQPVARGRFDTHHEAALRSGMGYGAAVLMTVEGGEMLRHELIDRVARELGISARQAQAALRLFADGATVPFVARYRKEVTGGLDELQLRELMDRALYLAELEERRATVLQSIEEQGKLDD